MGYIRKATEKGCLEHPTFACCADDMLEIFVFFGQCLCCLLPLFVNRQPPCPDIYTKASIGIMLKTARKIRVYVHIWPQPTARSMAGHTSHSAPLSIMTPVPNGTAALLPKVSVAPTPVTIVTAEVTAYQRATGR